MVRSINFSAPVTVPVMTPAGGHYSREGHYSYQTFLPRQMRYANSKSTLSPLSLRRFIVLLPPLPVRRWMKLQAW